MIDQRTLDHLQTVYQTTPGNVYREYAQHVFLSILYRQKHAGNLLFKGGTALRVIYKSPRFSEDLDFTGTGIRTREIEDTLVDVMTSLEQEHVACSLIDAKQTTGGYRALLHILVYRVTLPLIIEISLRGRVTSGMHTITIVNDYIPTYTAQVLPIEELATEKVTAALTRGKPRDFFDLYYLLRANLIPKQQLNRLIDIERILTKKRINFEKELGIFLPGSFRPVIRHFPEPLLAEIRRFR